MSASEGQATSASLMDEPLEMLLGMGGVLGAVVATEDGLPVAKRLPGGHDRDGMSAAAAAMGRLAGKTLDHLGKGRLEVATFEGSKLTFLVGRVSVGFLMSVVEPEAEVELIAKARRQAAAPLEEAGAGLAGR